MATVYDAMGGPAEKKVASYLRMTRVKIVAGVYEGERGYIMKVDHDLHGRPCYQVMIDSSGQETMLSEHEIKPRKNK